MSFVFRSRYTSKKALAAKAEAKIVTMDLPKRSPDLNVVDYSLWPTRCDASLLASNGRQVSDQFPDAESRGGLAEDEKGVSP